MTKISMIALVVLGACGLGCGASPSSTGKLAKTKSALTSSAVCTSYTTMTGPVNINILDLPHMYSPRCIQVAPGTVVTIAANDGHPLSGLDMVDGADVNPFTEPTGVGFMTAQTATLTDPGQYGFLCTYHGDGDTGAGMTGVISVVAPPGG